jgi:exopolysaccharide production protein ExoY
MRAFFADAFDFYRSVYLIWGYGNFNRKLPMTMHSTNLPNSESMSAVSIHEPKINLYRGGGKRALDIFLVVLTSPITVPVIFLLALALVLTGQSPFYSQKRIGLNGRVFRIWKLQTMVPDAEKRLDDYLQTNPDARAEWDKKQKLTNDPRITPVGRILRKTSLDELPQFFNVFNGTMSLIGPRPIMLCQQASYSGSAYYDMRPGVSGLWQIADRNEGDFTDRVLFDEVYNRVLSLNTDISVMLRTVVVMLRGTGC